MSTNWSKGIGNVLYYWIGILMLVILAINPIYELIFGNGWFLELIRAMIDGQSSDKWETIRILLIIFWIWTIGIVLTTPWTNFKSPLNFSLKSIWFNANKIWQETDQEARKNFIVKLAAGFAFLAVAFTIYLYLIYTMKNMLLNGEATTVLILAHIVMIVIMAWINSFWVNKIIEREGEVMLTANWFEVSNAPTDWENSNTLIVTIMIIILNIVWLWIAGVFSSNFEAYLNDSGTAEIINGDASSI